MDWNHSGDIRTIFIQGVIPLVLGIGLCVMGVLYMLGILKFTCCKKHDDQVAPVIIVSQAGRDNIHGDNNHQEGTAPMTRAMAERAYGPVACEANLWGMSPKERKAVLEAIFSSCCTHKESGAAASLDKKAGGCGNNKDEEASEDQSERVDLGLELDTRCACAICLREYEDNDVVLRGSNCTHIFHKHCAMVWLTNYRKPKDFCPYCRESMMNAQEMKRAAFDVLGEDRVRELTEFQRANMNVESNNNIIAAPDIESQEYER